MVAALPAGMVVMSTETETGPVVLAPREKAAKAVAALVPPEKVGETETAALVVLAPREMEVKAVVVLVSPEKAALVPMATAAKALELMEMVRKAMVAPALLMEMVGLALLAWASREKAVKAMAALEMVR
jgi:hypothetical protein